MSTAAEPKAPANTGVASGTGKQCEDLKDVISDLHAQLVLSRRELGMSHQARQAQAAELKVLKERLRSEQQRSESLQVRLAYRSQWS